MRSSVLTASKPGRPQYSSRGTRRQKSGSGSPLSGGTAPGPSSVAPSTKKAERQSSTGGGSSPSSGASERPSTKSGASASARSAKVGARSLLSTMCGRVLPSGTPGPLTTSGTLTSSS